MKKVIKTLLIACLFTSCMTISVLASEIKPKKQAIVLAPDNTRPVEFIQGGDIIGNLPPITIYGEGKELKGIFTYPNIDSNKLGVWDLEWNFIPDNTEFEPVSGFITVNIKTYEEYTGENPESAREITTPSLTASTVKLASFTTYDINLDNKVSGSTYAWTSSDTSVLDVNPKSGLVKAKKEGKATVTCKITLPDASTQILTSEVTVGYDDNAPLLTETSLDLETGDVFDINLENKVAKSKYRWVSSNKSVAKVNSANGKVTAAGPGEAYVTCTITTPDKQIIVLRCDVSVTAPATATE